MLHMADGPVANLPAGMDAYAGYVNRSGIGVTWPEVEQLPAEYHLSITTDGAPAMCGDVERGAMRTWRGYLVGYCSVSNALATIATSGRPAKLWTAHTGKGIHICGPHTCGTLPFTADATQWFQAAYDLSLLRTDFFSFQQPTTGGTVPPQPNETVDAWVLPGSNGSAGFELHADGGLFAWGTVTVGQLTYVAVASDGNRYHFGPNGDHPVFSYPGLPAPTKQGSRYFVAMVVLKYG